MRMPFLIFSLLLLGLVLAPLNSGWAQDEFKDEFKSDELNKEIKRLIKSLDKTDSRKEKLKILGKAEEKIFGGLLTEKLQVSSFESMAKQKLSPTDYYNELRKTMVEQFDEELFNKKLKKLSHGDMDVLKESFVQFLKDGRKNNNNLRLCFYVMDDRHKPPKNFSRFVTLWGRLNDAIASNKKEVIMETAYDLREHWKTFNLIEEVSTFKPTSETSFTTFITDNYNELNSYLNKPALTIHDFHELRKTFKNYLNVFLSFKQVNPTSNQELISLADKIDELSSRLGDMNDIYTDLDINDVINYKKYSVELNKNVRNQLIDIANEIQSRACTIHFLP